MSRSLSLCSQRCACGTLTKSIHWLDGVWVDDRVCENDEVRLAKTLSKAASVGCSIGDKKQTLHELACLAECCQDETEESKRTKGRVFACAAHFAQQNQEVIPLLIKCFRNDARLGRQTLRETETTQHFYVSPVAALFQQSSDMSDPYGTVFLGLCFENKDGVPRDKKKAIELFQQAAEMGNANGQRKLGQHLMNGYDIAKDRKKAIELYRQAVKKGDADAMVMLGIYGKYGNHEEKFIQLFRQAADMGNAAAMVELGDCLTLGYGVPEDKKKAIELYEQAADIGDKRATHNLYNHCIGKEGELPWNREFMSPQEIARVGDFYFDGHGLGKYEKEMARVGDFYFEGHGLRQDKKKAIALYERAAEMGDRDAMIRLAFCLKDGEDIEKDEKKATKLFRKVASEDKGSRMYRIATDYEQGRDVPQDQKKAVELFQWAADYGDVDAMSKVADFVLKGDDVAQDIEKAIGLYQQLARMGDAIEMVKLCVWHAEGNFDTQDKVKAIEWFQQAVDTFKAHEMNTSSFWDFDDVVLEAKEQFKSLVQQADEMDITEIITKLGIRCLDGTDIPKELEKAIYPTFQAERISNVFAAIHLGFSMMKRDGIEQETIPTKLLKQANAVMKSVKIIADDVLQKDIRSIPRGTQKTYRTLQLFCRIANVIARFILEKLKKELH